MEELSQYGMFKYFFYPVKKAKRYISETFTFCKRRKKEGEELDEIDDDEDEEA
jgi:hypothetical protein